MITTILISAFLLYLRSSTRRSSIYCGAYRAAILRKLAQPRVDGRKLVGREGERVVVLAAVEQLAIGQRLRRGIHGLDGVVATWTSTQVLKECLLGRGNCRDLLTLLLR